MRSALLAISLLCLPTHPVVPAQQLTENLIASATTYMDGLQRTEGFSGVVLIAREGKTLFAHAYGMANLEHDVPNTLDSKFRLGSITKQFTATGIMMLQERKKLSVRDSICQYIHPCPESWRPVTIHHLLSHTSGIPSFSEFPDNDHYERLPMTVLETIGRFRDKPLEFAPGARFKYSDSGYLLLGYVIEQVSGEKYEDFIRKNIYEQLRMQDSGYDHPWLILKHRAQGYSSEGGSLVNATPVEMDTPFAAGSQYSTEKDLLLWDQALYAEKLLSRDSLTAMFTPNPVPYPSGWFLSERGAYGYGWMIDELFGHKLYYHPGLIYGFSALIMHYPQDKTLIVILRNHDEEFPGNVRNLKIAIVGKNLSAIAFGGEPLR